MFDTGSSAGKKSLSYRALTEGVPNASKWSAHMSRICFLSVIIFPSMRKAAICERLRCSLDMCNCALKLL